MSGEATSQSSTRPAPDAAPEPDAAFVVDRVVPGRNATKADVVLGRRGDVEVALKDYGPRPFWIRTTLGRFLIRREARAYRALGAVDGVPRLLGRSGPFALVTSRVPGRPLADRDAGELDPRVFARLRAIVSAIHRRGVALGDLHHRDVLVTDDGTVHVVDLATAWVRGRTPWSAALFRVLRDQDRIAVARMEARFLGTDEDAAIAAVGLRARRWHRRGRTVRRLVDRIRGRRR